MRKLLLSCLLLVCWIAGASQDDSVLPEQKTLVLEDEISRYYLSPHIEVIADTLGHFTVADALLKFQEPRLIPVERNR